MYYFLHAYFKGSQNIICKIVGIVSFNKVIKEVIKKQWNRTGPKIDLWGTPEIIFRKDLLILLILTYYSQRRCITKKIFIYIICCKFCLWKIVQNTIKSFRKDHWYPSSDMFCLNFLCILKFLTSHVVYYNYIILWSCISVLSTFTLIFFFLFFLFFHHKSKLIYLPFVNLAVVDRILGFLINFCYSYYQTFVRIIYFLFYGVCYIV